MIWNKRNELVLCLAISLVFTSLYGIHYGMIFRQLNKAERVEFHKEDVHTIDEKTQISLPKQSNESPRRSSTIIVYDISKVNVTDLSLCVKSRTPTVFIICTWEPYKDIFISGHIQEKGQWEPKITKKIHDVLNQRRKISFLDIGANIGYFSLLAAAIGQPVVAVEPWRQHIKKFAMSIRMNNFGDKITVLNNAVSNTRRFVRIDMSWTNNQGVARLISEQEDVFISNGFNATSIIMDDLIDFISTKDVVIKIDIEGHECRAFEKADELFNKFNVLFISMEWVVMKLYKNKQGVACPAENIQKMVDMLTSRGFVPYSFTNDSKLDPFKHEMWTYVEIYWIPKPF